MKNLMARKSKGQAIILIALALMGLLGFTALAVDGSLMMLDRREAQGAADAAALAAAYEMMYNQTESMATSKGLAIAATDGFDNNGTTNTVNITYLYGADDPDDADFCNGTHLANHQGCVQVDVWHVTKKYFSSFIFSDGVSGEVRAVVIYQPGPVSEAYGMIATANDGSDPAMVFNGNPTVYFTGSGAYTDSALDIVGNVYVDSEAEIHGTGACAFNGSVEVIVGGVPYPEDDCDYNPEIVLPEMDYPTCPSNLSYNNIAAGPATFTNKVTLNSSTVTNIPPGVYCFQDGFETNGGATVAGTGVVFYVLGGEFKLNGGASNQLFAPTEASPVLDGAGEEEWGTLIYMAPGAGAITINGNASTGFEGVVYSPDNDCTFNGTGSSMTMNTNIICSTINIGGTAGVNFNMGDGWDTHQPSKMQLIQ